MSARNLKKERIEKDLSLEDVGKILGITKQSLFAIENGQNDPSYKVLCKLEALFGKPHSYLLAQTAVEDEKYSTYKIT